MINPLTEDSMTDLENYSSACATTRPAATEKTATIYEGDNIKRYYRQYILYKWNANFYIHRWSRYPWIMGDTVKVIELVGNSTESWEDAAQNALDDADATLENISGIEITSQTADVDDGQIERYKTTVDVAFELEDR